MKLSVWKDRPRRTRVMALLGNGKHEDARRYYYKQYYPNEDIKGYRILQLDMDPFNFNKDNLVKVTPRVMNCLLNNHLLTNNADLNKVAIQAIELELLSRDLNEKKEDNVASNKQEYNKKYYQEHKEKLSTRRKERYLENLESEKERRKNYYQNNKDNVLASNKKWRENNKEQFNKIVHARRKSVAEELKKQGQMYTYLPRAARELKMVNLLCKKIGYSEQDSRDILEKNNWNIKSILEEL